MDRHLEPELMVSQEQAAAYANSNLEYANQLFVHGLMEEYPDSLVHVLDIGCGPAYVPIEIARRRPDANITAIDGSSAMIKLARQAINSAGVSEQVSPIHGYVPDLRLRDHSYDLILSKDTLHHFHDPGKFWNEAKRLAKPGAAIYVMDLIRPESSEEAKNIVKTLTGEQSQVLQKDFYNSLCAAFSLEEVKDQIEEAGLCLKVKRMSERHLLVSGRMQRVNSK